MKNNRTLLSVLGILGNAALIELAILALAGIIDLVTRAPFSGMGYYFFILGILILFVAGFGIGGVRRNYGILPLVMPLQKILTEKNARGLDSAAHFMLTYSFSLYVGLAGLISFLLGIYLNVRFPNG